MDADNSGGEGLGRDIWRDSEAGGVRDGVVRSKEFSSGRVVPRTIDADDAVRFDGGIVPDAAGGADEGQKKNAVFHIFVPSFQYKPSFMGKAIAMGLVS